MPEEITLHALRHAHATVLLAAGVPIPAISKRLGHSSTRLVLELYGHVVPEMEQDLSRRLEDALG